MSLTSPKDLWGRMWDLWNNVFFCYLSFLMGNVMGAIFPVHEYYQLCITSCAIQWERLKVHFSYSSLSFSVRIKQREGMFSFPSLCLLGKASSEKDRISRLSEPSKGSVGQTQVSFFLNVNTLNTPLASHQDNFCKENSFL